MRKLVNFCAGSTILGNSTHELKNFSMTTVQQRIKENRKSLKMRFRMMIRDYSKLFKSAKDKSEVDKAFKQDLYILLAEAVSEVQNGGTLNSVIGLTMLVPGARKINNQLNILIKKIGKFYKKNNYISPMLQKKFYSMLDELITAVSERVGSGEINQEELDKEDEEENVEQNTKTVKASATKTRLVMYASEEEMNKLMDNIDIDNYPIEDVSPESIVFEADELPEGFEDIKFSGMTRRSKTFNSEMINICFITPLIQHSYKQTFEDSIRRLKLHNIIDTDQDVNNIDYSASELDDGNVKYVVSINADKVKLSAEDDQKGVYSGKSMPNNWVSLFNDDKTPYDELVKMIDGGLTTSTLMKIESYLNSKSDAEKDSIRSFLTSKYGENPIAKLL